jgi:glutamate-1-semialdehyde 2,1-aminomutase
MRHEAPRDEFLSRVRALADQTGAVLIFDEITSGWRTHFGGLHLALGVNPDVAVFAKAMSNGFPMAAIIGRDRVMDAAQETFVSLARLEEVDICRHIADSGKQVLAGWTAAAHRHALPAKVGGIPALCLLSFDAGPQSRALMTLFTQEMLSRGFLSAGAFYPTLAHRAEVIEPYLSAVDEVFAVMKRQLDRGPVTDALRGPIAHSGFARLT